MANKTIISKPFLTLMALTLLIYGCAIGGPGPIVNMRVLPPDVIKTKSDEGKAMVIFVRSSGHRNRYQSSVFEIKDGKPIIIGNLAAMKKLTYQFEPGEHLFMVLSESADFMTANLETDKTYYADIEPRMGVVRSRFSFQPLSGYKLSTPEMQQALSEAEWVEKTADTEHWADENRESILTKYNSYYPKWNKKRASAKPHLGKEREK